MKVCSVPGCPILHKMRGHRCPKHAAAHERERGTRQQRGYGAGHQRLRVEWEPRVATGTVPCARCGELIAAGERWDLGHDDHDRTKYRGPEHADRCNRAAAGRSSHH